MDGYPDEIVTELSVDQVKQDHMTQGLIDNYSLPNPGIPIPVDIQSLHHGFGGWTEMKYPQNSELK